MELGVFSLTDIQPEASPTPSLSAGQRLDDIVSYGLLADRLGLDVFGIGEHHSAAFAVSSPAVALAAVASSTQRIRLASTVTVLTTLDPVRVYQDFATLDLLSHGRAEIIAGRSAFIEPFALFGVNAADYDGLFAEKLELLLLLRDNDRVNWSGQFRAPLEDVAISPRSFVAQLPVWVGVGGTPASAERAGRLGLPMALGLIGGTIERARHVIDIYRSAGERAGHDSDRLRVGIVSHLYVGENGEAARADVYPYYHRYLARKTPGGRGFVVDRPSMTALAARGGALMVGGPEEITEKILDLHDVLGADRFLGQIDFGGLPREQVNSSVELFATEVAPVARRELGGRATA